MSVTSADQPPAAEQRGCAHRAADAVVLQYLREDDEFHDTVRKLCVVGALVAAVLSLPYCFFFWVKYFSRGADAPSWWNGELGVAIAFLGFTLTCFVCYGHMRMSDGVVPGWITLAILTATNTTAMIIAICSEAFPTELSVMVSLTIGIGARVPHVRYYIVGCFSICLISAARFAWPDVVMLPHRHTFTQLEGFLVNIFSMPLMLVQLLYVAGIDHTFGSKVTHMSKAQRDNSLAPTDTEEPVAVMFTDIQSSTNLWATVPAVMAAALETHNVVVRETIAAHQGYEVKTVGDAFVVVFKSADDALAAALDIQEQLYKADWDDNGEVDRAYQHLAADLPPVERVNVPTDTQSYAASWRGLRVRIGVHVGLCDIKFDETTKGYDYFGSTMNTAARIEGVGHGGMVCLSEAAVSGLQGGVPASQYVAVNLGEHLLRGVTDPVHLAQYLPSLLMQRRFPALKAGAPTASQAAFEDEYTAEHHETADGETEAPAESHAARMLEVMLSALPAKDRTSRLQELCGAWKIEWQRGRDLSSNCRRLGRRLDVVDAAKSHAHHESPLHDDSVLVDSVSPVSKPTPAAFPVPPLLPGAAP